MKVNEEPEGVASRPSGQSYSIQVWKTGSRQCRLPRIGWGGTRQLKVERLRTE